MNANTLTSQNDIFGAHEVCYDSSSEFGKVMEEIMADKKILDEFPDLVNANKNLTQKQKDVLIVSIQLFAKQGYANTSTRQIAEAAHQSEGTMFKHFKSKANILREALDPIVREVVPDLLNELASEAIREQTDNIHDFFVFFVRNRMKFASDNEDALKVFLSEILYNADLRKQYLSIAPERFLNSFKTIIKAAQDRGQLVDWPFRIIFRYLLSILGSYFFDRYILFPERDWDDATEEKYMVSELDKTLAVHPDD